MTTKSSKAIAASVSLCAALLCSPAGAVDLMNGTTKGGIRYIGLAGDIDDDTPDLVERYISTLSPAPTVIMLDSPGGSVAGGVGLGEVIRQASMKSVIPADASCFSACAFAFIGGTARAVFDGGKLGMHQFRWEAARPGFDAAGSAQAMAGVLIQYFQAMGVDPMALTIAMATPPNTMHVFDAAELSRYRLTADPPRLQANTSGTCPFPAGHKVEDPLGLFPECAR